MMYNSLLQSLLAIAALGSSAAAAAQSSESDAPPPGEPPVAVQSPTAAAGEPAKPAVEQNSGLEDIVVTATRREERLQDIPVSVTAVTAKTLGGSGITHVRELTQIVPGLFGARNAGVTQPVVRGVGSTGPGVGDEANVAIYIDGIYQADQFTTSLDLVEVERVEVLRGPQGTVFGRNATGGLINIITPDPSFTSRGRIAGKVGRMRNDANSYDLRGYATGALSTMLAADIALLYRRNDGYVDDLVRGGDSAEQRLWSVRSKLLFQPSDRARFILSGEYTDSNEEQPAFQPYLSNTAGRRYPGVIVADDPYEISNDVEPRLAFKRYNVGLRTRFELGAVNLETSTGYMRADVEQRADSDASNIPLAYTDVEVHPRTISQELRLLSAAPGRLNWLVGAYAFHLRGAMPFEIGGMPRGHVPTGGPPPPFVITRLNPKVRTTSYAAFAEGTYELVDKLFLTLGGRYTTEKRTFRQNFNGIQLDENAPAVFPRWPEGGTAKKTFDKFTYRTALRYEFAEDANVYVTHGTGFKSGVFNIVGVSPVAVDPETITAYEIGLKVDPLDWLRTNLSAYYYDYKDLQASARTASGAFTLQNAATAEIYGGELEITASPIRDLDIRASAAYTHAEYTKFDRAAIFTPQIGGGNLPGEGNVAGNHMVRAPRYTFSFGGNYRWDLGGGRAEINGNLFRSGKLYYDFLNAAKQPAYTLLNGELAWTTPDKGWRLSLWGTNLTDAKVYQMLQAGGPATTSFYQKPRMIGVGAERRF